MKVVIEQRHTLNTEFNSCTDCALRRAIIEQYGKHIFLSPSVRLTIGGEYIRYNREIYPFDTSLWNGYYFKQLQQGSIDKVEICIPFPLIDNIKSMPEPPKVKYKTVYVTVSECFKEAIPQEQMN